MYNGDYISSYSQIEGPTRVIASRYLTPLTLRVHVLKILEATKDPLALAEVLCCHGILEKRAQETRQVVVPKLPELE